MLLCPGPATSRWPGFGGDVVDPLGIRLVAVDRPGLGASDPAPGRTREDWAQDVRHFAEARVLPGTARRPALLSSGQSQKTAPPVDPRAHRLSYRIEAEA